MAQMKFIVYNIVSNANRSKLISIMKRIAFVIVCLLFKIQLIAQTQYDYYDDGAVAGGADRALNGIIIIGGIVIIAVALFLLLYGVAKIYYWFNPTADPEYKRMLVEKEKEAKRSKEKGAEEKKQAIRDDENNRKKDAVNLGISVLWADSNMFAESSKEEIIKTTDISLYAKYRATFALTEKPRTNDIMLDLELRKMYSDDGQKLISTHNGAGGWGKGQININPKPGTKIICDNAYDDYDNRFVEEILIPDSVVAIGYNAFVFLGVDNLFIPASVRYITGNPFGRPFGHYNKANCDSKYFKMTNGVLYSSDNLLYVANIESEAKYKSIPDGFKIIGRGAINGHDELELLRVPPSVVAIAEGAISGCKNLNVIIFEGKVDVIEPTAINKNESIKALYVPIGLINYYQNILPKELKDFVKGLPNLDETDEVILNRIIVQEDTLMLNTSKTEPVTKNTISSSDLELINQIKKDYEITAVAPEDWDDKVIDWGEHENEEHDCWDRGEASYSKDGKRFLIFEDELTEYRIRDGVEILCDNAFTNGCDDKSIILPKTVTTIGNFVFWHTYLEEFVIPDSVVKITGNPFVKCEVNLKCNASGFCLDGKVLYDKEKKRIVSVIDDIERTVQNKPVQIAPTVKIIGRNSFYEISCGSVTLPNSVLYIGDAAFKNSIISDISLGENVYEIGKAAFAHSFISYMNLPDSVKVIGESAFEYCDRLKTIRLSANLTAIEADTFTNCNYLNDVYIPNGVKIIKRGAFSWCKSLTRIFLPNSIEKIEKEAFVYCGFKTVIIPKHTIVEEGAFTNDCKVVRRE